MLQPFGLAPLGNHRPAEDQADSGPEDDIGGIVPVFFHAAHGRQASQATRKALAVDPIGQMEPQEV